MAFTSLKKILPRRLKQAGIERGVQAAQVLQIANKVLDELFGSKTTAQHAQAASLKYKQLNIATVNASLRQEISLRQKEIVGKIMEQFDKIWRGEHCRECKRKRFCADYKDLLLK